MKDTTRDGYGTYVLSNRDIYKGQFKMGVKHGYGKYTYAKGGLYYG